ncbi:MAG TPA: hypothetical protein VEF76_05265 [Patescibacteria group bacterium]|nr:hypothetical protein [Patescibacteria group bacterium]
MLPLLGLITLVMLIVFTLIYLSGTIPKKPAALEKFLAAVKKNIDTLAVLALLYGFVAAFLVPILMAGKLSSGITIVYMFLPMLANLVLVVMALPYAFHKIEAPLRAKMNVAIMTEITNLMGWITSNEKILGFLGAALIVLSLVFSIV